MSDDELSEHVRLNRHHWDRHAIDYAASGERAWACVEPTWGVWQVPESALGVLPATVAGMDAIELGCGTAYISAWLARRGARVVGIDNSAAQLATARRLQQKHGLEFPLLHADAERVPCRGGTFDLAISEYGACLWADPARWVSEAARVVRPGGQLVFLSITRLATICMPDEESAAVGDRLLRPAFGGYRMLWSGDSGVEFHPGHGDWIRLLRRNGFEIEDLIEIQAPAGAVTRYAHMDPDWAHQWPSEEVWKARRR